MYVCVAECALCSNAAYSQSLRLTAKKIKHASMSRTLERTTKQELDGGGGNSERKSGRVVGFIVGKGKGVSIGGCASARAPRASTAESFDGHCSMSAQAEIDCVGPAPRTMKRARNLKVDPGRGRRAVRCAKATRLVLQNLPGKHDTTITN